MRQFHFQNRALFSGWVKNHLKKTLFSPPEIVGISLFHAGQVIPAAATTIVARSIWPQSLIVWGGPHMSGLGKETILEDIPQRAFAADLFVAESTFLNILESCESKAELAFKDHDQPRHLTGRRGKSTATPIFQDLTCYDRKSLTLPVQSTLGCAYGRCAFCTYPAIEPTPTRLALDLSVNSVVCQAAQIPGASVAIEDSLVTPGRLKAISSCIDERVPWSACTNLNEKLDLSNLRGLSTLEIL